MKYEFNPTYELTHTAKIPKTQHGYQYVSRMPITDLSALLQEQQSVKQATHIVFTGEDEIQFYREISLREVMETCKQRIEEDLRDIEEQLKELDNNTNS